MQPIFDLLEEPIPGVSDLSEKIGGDQVNLLFMSKALSALPNPPTELLNVINSVNQSSQIWPNWPSIWPASETRGSQLAALTSVVPEAIRCCPRRRRHWGICISTNGRPWSSTATVSISPG